MKQNLFRSARVSAHASLALGMASSFMLTACGPDFDPGTQVSSLRVLAVQVDSPFASPGQTVRLNALSHDPLERPINWAWAVCQNPVSSTVEACIGDILQSAAASGAPMLLAQGEGVDSVELQVPADALDRLPPQARPQALMGVLSIACPGTLDFRSSANSASALPITCTDGNGTQLGLHDYVIGVKRIFLRETEQNQNPVIDAILFDGGDWPADEIKEVDACATDEFVFDDCEDSDPHRIAASVSPDSFQTGQNELGGDFTEQVIVQHYTTDGIFEDEVRIAAEAETRWVARSGSSGSEQSLWFVARDDRGGVSWAERRVRVR